jgi:hypothetical protein
MPAVEDWGGTLDVSKLPIKARKWIKVPDIVAVVADMKNSTKLGTGKRAPSTASIYDAGPGGVVEIYNRFEADFLQIQGDGVFALFWGDGVMNAQCVQESRLKRLVKTSSHVLRRSGLVAPRWRRGSRLA